MLRGAVARLDLRTASKKDVALAVRGNLFSWRCVKVVLPGCQRHSERVESLQDKQAGMSRWQRAPPRRRMMRCLNSFSLRPTPRVISWRSTYRLRCVSAATSIPYSWNRQALSRRACGPGTPMCCGHSKPRLARATFMWLSNIRARRTRRWLFA